MPLPSPHRASLLALLALVTAASCATAPKIGVRRGFEQTKLRFITIAPPYSTSQFGIPDAQWQQFEHVTVDRIEVALAGLGFAPESPEALRDQLERDGKWEQFTRLFEFDGGLDNRFEPSLYAPPSAEVAELQEMAADGVLGETPLLIVELVYQSTGECQLDSREFNRFATVVRTDGAPIDTPRPGPCIVTHIQAKLVDPASATTMWHNRVLRDMRGPDLGTADAVRNIKVATEELIRGPHGLAPFAPGPTLPES